MVSDKVDKGVVACLGSFISGAREFAESKNITLIDVNDIIKMIWIWEENIDNNNDLSFQERLQKLIFYLKHIHGTKSTKKNTTVKTNDNN